MPDTKRTIRSNTSRTQHDDYIESPRKNYTSGKTTKDNTVRSSRYSDDDNLSSYETRKLNRDKVVRAPTPPPLIQRVVEREPTPEPVVVERVSIFVHFLKNSNHIFEKLWHKVIVKPKPQRVIERVIERPSTPPIKIIDKEIDEPEPPPIIRTR